MKWIIHNNSEFFSQNSEFSANFWFVFANLIEKATHVTIFWNLARNPEKFSSKVRRKNAKFEVFEISLKFCWKFLNMSTNLKISTRKIGFRKSWKIMCAVAKCKSKKFSLFSTFAVAFSCSFFVAFLSLKTTKKNWYDELFYPKSHTLAGSVSELSHISLRIPTPSGFFNCWGVFRLRQG